MKQEIQEIDHDFIFSTFFANISVTEKIYFFPIIYLQLSTDVVVQTSQESKYHFKRIPSISGVQK